MKSNRLELYKAVPIKSPLLLQIFPCYACNFKCNYCLHALPREKHGFISQQTFMDIGLFIHAVDEIALSKSKIKMLRFAAIGEPLLHPQIVDMVRYAQEKEIADSVEIVTNGALLTEALSDALIHAGLTVLRVSLQGLTSGEYKENCGADVDFNRIKNMIAYYYSHCGSSRVYVKIIDHILGNDGIRIKAFYDLFTTISHIVAIEHLTPTVEGIDFKKIANGVELSLTQDGNAMTKTHICPQPFYMLQINPDGNLTVCCSVKYPGLFGHVETTGLLGAWNGSKLMEFRKKSLVYGTVNASNACATCKLYHYSFNEEDVLDGHEEEILKRL